MEDDAKKEARRKKLADHRKWLEEMKAKQGEIAAKHSQQRTESMRKSLLRKTERAIQPRRMLGFLLTSARIIRVENDLAAMKSGENEKQSISSKHVGCSHFRVIDRTKRKYCGRDCSQNTLT